MLGFTKSWKYFKWYAIRVIFSLSFSSSRLSPTVSPFLSVLALFKRTTLLSAIVVALFFSGKLIQSTRVMPAKFPVSAREWPRDENETFLKLVDFTTVLAISLISLIEKCIYPGWSYQPEGYLRNRKSHLFSIKQSTDAAMRATNAFPYGKNNISMHKFPDLLY